MRRPLQASVVWHLSLQGRWSAELRCLHHGRGGAPHPRHEPGDV